MNDIEIEMQVKYVNLDLPMYEHQIRRTVYKITLNCIKKKKRLVEYVEQEQLTPGSLAPFPITL